MIITAHITTLTKLFSRIGARGRTLMRNTGVVLRELFVNDSYDSDLERSEKLLKSLSHSKGGDVFDIN